MIDLAILGLLKEQDLHGYELRKQLGELPGWRPAVSFGSLYPALARLEKAGSVKAVTHLTSPTPPVPMSGSLAGELAAFRAHRRSSAQSKANRSGRGKKVYGITSTGEDRLQQLLVGADIVDDRQFAIALAFCHHLDPADRLALFRARRAELLRRRDQEGRRRGSESRFNAYLRSLIERDSEATTADLAWLDRLIDGELAATDVTGHLGGES